MASVPNESKGLLEIIGQAGHYCKFHSPPAGRIIPGINRRWLLKTNHKWTRMDTNTNGAPLVGRRQGMKPPGSAGVSPAPVLAQPRPPPPPGSTGNGARTLLRPSPCRIRRQGDRAPHRGETERHATGVHAGGTPALPGGASSHHSCAWIRHAPACRAAAVPMRRARHAWWPFVGLRVPSWIAPLLFDSGAVRCDNSSIDNHKSKFHNH